jgi:Lon protease-like protein
MLEIKSIKTNGITRSRVMKVNKQKTPYKYQVLNSWDITTADSEEDIQEYDSYEHAVKVANNYAKQQGGS